MQVQIHNRMLNHRLKSIHSINDWREANALHADCETMCDSWPLTKKKEEKKIKHKTNRNGVNWSRKKNHLTSIKNDVFYFQVGKYDQDEKHKTDNKQNNESDNRVEQIDNISRKSTRNEKRNKATQNKTKQSEACTRTSHSVIVTAVRFVFSTTCSQCSLRLPIYWLHIVMPNTEDKTQKWKMCVEFVRVLVIVIVLRTCFIR